MIKLANDDIDIDDEFRNLIETRMISNTSKTNLSPQLMFKQSYTGLTDKAFIGNWTKTGFWISKFRKQLFEVRPDIIARFDFYKLDNKTILKLKYSIGFSSLFKGLLWILMFSIIFFSFGLTGFIIAFLFLLCGYILLTFSCIDETKSKINDKIFIDN